MSEIDYRERHAAQKTGLQGVIDGTQVGHVWTSPRFEGVDMVIQYAAPDDQISPDSHGLPAGFAKDVELGYSGLMSKERAAEKLASMQVAERAAHA
jgi:hypothetical protein